MMMEKYLVMVDPAANHNKFYRMIPNGNVFKAVYGRVGTTGMEKLYPMNMFDMILDQKLQKGYQDMSKAHEDTDIGTVDTGNAETDRLISMMMSWSNDYVRHHMDGLSDSVNAESVKEAQKIIDDLSISVGSLTVSKFNRSLTRLFTLVPRAVHDVSSLMAHKKADFDPIIIREQDLLDAISAKTPSVSTDGSGKNPLPWIHIEPCDRDTTDMVISHMDDDSRIHAKRAFHVYDEHTRKTFDAYVKKEHIGKSGVRFLYHGSRNQNYFSILKNGLLIRPSGAVTTGNMFGYGLYFAPKARKSVGYTSLSGSYWANGSSSSALLLVYKVALGHSRDLYSYDQTVSQWTEADCRRAGYQSVYAHASKNPSLHSGRLYNDECVVYTPDACTLSYIVELA